MVLDVDLSGWPIAIVTRSGDGGGGDHPGVDGVGGVEGVQSVGPVLGSLLDRKERFGLVLDLGRQNDTQQADFAAWLHRNRVRAQRYVVGCALVLPESAVGRGRDLLGARPQLYPFPAWVASSRDECRAWVEGVLASSGPRRTSRGR